MRDGPYHPRESPLEPHLDASSVSSPEKKQDRESEKRWSFVDDGVTKWSSGETVRCPTGEAASVLLVTESRSSCNRGAYLPRRSITGAAHLPRSITGASLLHRSTTACRRLSPSHHRSFSSSLSHHRSYSSASSHHRSSNESRFGCLLYLVSILNLLCLLMFKLSKLIVSLLNFGCRLMSLLVRWELRMQLLSMGDADATTFDDLSSQKVYNFFLS